PADAVQSLVDVSDGLADAFFASAQRTLRALLADADLLRDQAPVAPDRFARRLLVADPANRFGIWSLSWPPGWRTPIHDHHCACAFGVYRGRIDEVLYTVGAGGAVVESTRHRRQPGYVGGAPLEQGVVHEMLNPGEDTAVSVHIYAYRPDRHADSIDRRFARRPEEEAP